MSSAPHCPQCHSPAVVYDGGTTTPENFFGSQHRYTIAAVAAHERLPIYKCTSCGHGFTPLEIKPSVLVEWYSEQEPDTTFLADEVARRVTARQVLHRIAKHIPKRGQLLDVGAGPGIFVSESNRQGWNATGLEPSSWAATYGQENYHVHMIQADMAALESLPAHSYDAITMFDVIEHVIDPATLVKAASRLLKPGGLLVITTPKFDSAVARLMAKKWYCMFPAHLHYFTQASMEKTLQTAGLKIVQQKTHTRYLSAHYLWQRLKELATGKKPVAAGQKKYHTSIPVNLGDEFELYAQPK